MRVSVSIWGGERGEDNALALLPERMGEWKQGNDRRRRKRRRRRKEGAKGRALETQKQTKEKRNRRDFTSSTHVACVVAVAMLSPLPSLSFLPSSVARAVHLFDEIQAGRRPPLPSPRPFLPAHSGIAFPLPPLYNPSPPSPTSHIPFSIRHHDDGLEECALPASQARLLAHSSVLDRGAQRYHLQLRRDTPGVCRDGMRDRASGSLSQPVRGLRRERLRMRSVPSSVSKRRGGTPFGCFANDDGCCKRPSILFPQPPPTHRISSTATPLWRWAGCTYTKLSMCGLACLPSGSRSICMQSWVSASVNQ